jgi:hypothetical protein
VEEIAADVRDARPGHLDHHFSAAFQQIACGAFEVRLEPGQRTVRIVIEQDADQLDDFVIFHDQVDGFLHHGLVSDVGRGRVPTEQAWLTLVIKVRHDGNDPVLYIDFMQGAQYEAWLGLRPIRDRNPPILLHPFNAFGELLFAAI